MNRSKSTIATDFSSLSFDARTVLKNCADLIASPAKFQKILLQTYRAELVEMQQRLKENAAAYERAVHPIVARMEQFQESKNQKSATNQLNLPQSHGESSDAQRRAGSALRSGAAETNPLDIWQFVAAFYENLPTRAEIENMCARREPRAAPAQRENWRKALEPCYEKLKRDACVKKKRTPLAAIPGPPPPPDEQNSFWMENAAPFPMEQQQQQNANLIHYVLSAFVESSRANRAKLSGAAEQSSDPLFFHPLPPALPFNEYMSCPFDERLEMELQAVGLQKPEDEQNNNNLPLAGDISMLEKSIEKNQEKVDRIRDEFLPKLESFYGIEMRRNESQNNYFNLMNSKPVF